MQPLLDDVYTWSVHRPGSFKGVAFNGTYLVAGEARIMIDPPPLNDWEHEHLEQLGAPTTIVVTNANHLRAAPALRDRYGAELWVPAADADRIDAEVDGTFTDGDAIGPLTVIGLADQKTPGESALHWAERRTLIVGDAIIGAPRHGLSLLPDAKFKDVAKARAGLQRLGELDVDVLLVGDGEPLLEGAGHDLRAFLGGEVAEVPLEPAVGGPGQAPAAGRHGWYVLNVAESGWIGHERFGTWSNLEGQRGRFRQLGLNISVLQPGKPACLYHGETTEENFLVLEGECSVVIEDQVRALKAWDFVHCPPGTRHVFEGGEAPAAVLMVGTRDAAAGILYPPSEVAGRFGAAVSEATWVPEQAYGSVGLTQRPQACAQAWPLG